VFSAGTAVFTAGAAVFSTGAAVACTGAAVGVAAGAQETSVIEMTRITPKMTISLDLTKVLITLSP
jgi:hypothetical protein